MLIEILSSKTEMRDRTTKLNTYSKFNVLEYWMASEEKKTVEVWRRQSDKLVFHELLNKTQTLTTPLLRAWRFRWEKFFKNK